MRIDEALHQCQLGMILGKNTVKFYFGKMSVNC